MDLTYRFWIAVAEGLAGTTIRYIFWLLHAFPHRCLYGGIIHVT
jgi:hypothetical protein